METRPYDVDGQPRQALVHAPAGRDKPVIFAFHGHYLTSRQAADHFAFHELWPEAVCVYPQGLKTRTRVDPLGRGFGWQNSIVQEGGRDLKFFDAMLAHLIANDNIDQDRVYSAGHSNGGNFTYVLWPAKGEKLAAVAAVAAVAAERDQNDPDPPPKPVLHVAGMNDRVVRFQDQLDTIEKWRELNGCADTGGSTDCCTEYDCKVAVVACIHEGGHEIPDFAGECITRFFRTH